MRSDQSIAFYKSGSNEKTPIRVFYLKEQNIKKSPNCDFKFYQFPDDVTIILASSQKSKNIAIWKVSLDGELEKE
jgi:hypothetical protein